VHTKPGALVLNHTRPCQAYTHSLGEKNYDNQVATSFRPLLQEFDVGRHFGRPTG
jgi:hypothetical protein